jgi:undecaprenyl-diphosphatase
MSSIEILILALVEGVTEFLPISSTGHLIIVSKLISSESDSFRNAFNIIIQFGAILAVLVLYPKRLKWNFPVYTRIALAFLPAGILGLLFKKKIDIFLDSTHLVAMSLIIGGGLLIFLDRFLEKKNQSNLISIDNLPYRLAILIGLFQCLAFVPGVSRAGASIVAALLLGMKKRDALEFSFLLAIPTLSGAAFIKTLSIPQEVLAFHWGELLFGTLMSFVFALIAIRYFVKIVEKAGFKWFGYYRISLGLSVFIFGV